MTAATKEQPIIFSGPMVKAIIEGRKTMTRRVCKPQPEEYRKGVYSLPRCVGIPENALSNYLVSGQDRDLFCPYGSVGDRLWVRETWRECGSQQQSKGPPIIWKSSEVVFKADDPTDGPWRSPIHMPRLASRLTLEITDVRVERLQAMHHDTEAFEAEGIELPQTELYPHTNRADKLERRFADLWDRINGKKHPWSSNPWVWVVTFKRLQAESQEVGQG